MNNPPLTLALPRGRILRDIAPCFPVLGLEPDPGLFDPSDRRLQFAARAEGGPELRIVRVRSFDAATFVAFGGAELGLAGTDVLEEFRYAEVFAPVDLGLSRCRMVVAESRDLAAGDDPRSWSRVRVATKYPRLAERHFAARGVQAEVVALSGAVELAPGLGLARRIVDLVDTGRTLEANNLAEVERVGEVSVRLIVNRTALKLRHGELLPWIARFARLAGEGGGGRAASKAA